MKKSLWVTASLPGGLRGVWEPEIQAPCLKIGMNVCPLSYIMYMKLYIVASYVIQIQRCLKITTNICSELTVF